MKRVDVPTVARHLDDQDGYDRVDGGFGAHNVPHCGMPYDGFAMADIEHAQLVFTYINEWRCRHYPGV